MGAEERTCHLRSCLLIPNVMFVHLHTHMLARPIALAFVVRVQPPAECSHNQRSSYGDFQTGGRRLHGCDCLELAQGNSIAIVC